MEEWRAGQVDALNADDKDTINIVLEAYADKDAQFLSDLTHKEQPWQLARVGLDANERGKREISLASMMEYYSSLPANE